MSVIQCRLPIVLVTGAHVCALPSALMHGVYVCATQIYNPCILQFLQTCRLIAEIKIILATRAVWLQSHTFIGGAMC